LRAGGGDRPHGSIERDRDGRLYFYDINALSNVVADAPHVVGFDPFARLVDWLEVLMRAEVPAAPASI
jgi:hypothetical protein